jgi:hypothetical protein
MLELTDICKAFEKNTVNEKVLDYNSTCRKLSKQCLIRKVCIIM